VFATATSALSKDVIVCRNSFSWHDSNIHSSHLPL